MESASVYDIAIIGGGIAGTSIASLASSRKHTVILFEKNSLGSGASSKSSKLIHGGIRYLELAWEALKRLDIPLFWKNFRFVFLSLKEARELEEQFPQLIKPIALLTPIYRDSPRKPFAVHTGVRVYYLLACLSGRARAPQILKDKEAVLRAAPDLNPEGLLGGVIFWDRWTDDLALVCAHADLARHNNAEILENTKIVRYKKLSSGLFEILAEQNSEQIIFHARQVVNATGAWLDEVKNKSEQNLPNWISPVAGSHIQLKPFTGHSCLLQASDRRIFFVLNIGGQTRVGTTERPCQAMDNLKPTTEEIDYLLDQLRHYFPGKAWAKEEILSQDAGARPLVRPSREQDAHSISRDHEIRQSPLGAWHVLGVKLTDHARAARAVLKKLNL